VVALGALVLPASTVASARPADVRATAARSCAPPKFPGVGYFTSVSATGVGCETANRLVLAYYRCRVRSGKAGRCRKPVLGFRCTEIRNSIPTEIDARVSCHRRGAKVIHTYQQDL
jgi:hypothetical protein